MFIGSIFDVYIWVRQGSPRKLVKSDYSGTNLVILCEIGKEDPKILEYATSLINFIVI